MRYVDGEDIEQHFYDLERLFDKLCKAGTNLGRELSCATEFTQVFQYPYNPIGLSQDRRSYAGAAQAKIDR